MIIFDTKVKVEVDLHYLGNVKRSRETTPKWYEHYIHLMNERFPGAQIYLDANKTVTPVTVGTKERTPISDVLYFKNEGISLLDLYQHYYNTTTEYTQAIKNSQENLARLGYFAEKDAPRIYENLHPIFPRMIQLWTQKGYPKLAILIVIAVVTSYSQRFTEIRKSDEHSSRFEDMLESYLNLMRMNNSACVNDTHGIGERLRALCDAYMEKDVDEYSLFRMEDIMKSLTDLIHEHFENYIITQHVDTYRSKFNQTLVWKLTGSDDQVQHKNIFPLVVYSTGNVKRVALYIPVGVN
jgi:hypothetical protein